MHFRAAPALACGALLLASARCTLLVDTSGFDVQPDDAALPDDVGIDDARVAEAPADSGLVDARGTLWPVNGHRYELVVPSSAIGWVAARDQAMARGGHLATLTSAEENDFVFALIPSSVSSEGRTGPWVGGYQDPTDAKANESWRWVTSEPWSFAAWGGGAPDDNRGQTPEYYLHYYWSGPSRVSTWNDGTPQDTALAFVVEYE